MKTKLFLILAVLLPLSAFNMNADENEPLPPVKEIPLKQGNETKINRSLDSLPIEACYYRMMSCIQTIVTENIGDVNVTVTNCSTGDVWYESFDSSLQPQIILPISGTPGYYLVTYITESSDIYEGTFTIH